jgi:hypothetical protein
MTQLASSETQRAAIAAAEPATGLEKSFKNCMPLRNESVIKKKANTVVESRDLVVHFQQLITQSQISHARIRWRCASC